MNACAEAEIAPRSRPANAQISPGRTASPAAFVPEMSEMYPPGFATTVTIDGLTDTLCGAARPGHFTGVSTVVTKLLLQCQATREQANVLRASAAW